MKKVESLHLKGRRYMKINVEESFLLSHILKCGQTFRYEEMGDEDFFVISKDKRIRVRQVASELELSCDEADFDAYWRNYFDLGLSYTDVKREILDIEPSIKPYMDELYGIRILRQDAFEMLITFILSQNNSMTNIKKVVDNICTKYGNEISDDFGTYHSFPTADMLKNVSKEDFRALKCGFRDKYLVNALEMINSGELDLDKLRHMSTAEARTELMKVKGIGRKVADCILLFGFYRLDVFPIDVWTRRAITKMYFNDEKVKDDLLLDKTYEKFGELSGIAQQYIFYGIVNENK